jgi:hypothetical protein
METFGLGSDILAAILREELELKMFSVLRVELEPKTFSLTRAATGSGTPILKPLSKPIYHSEQVRYELDRSIVGEEDALCLSVQNDGEQPESCKGTLFVSPTHSEHNVVLSRPIFAQQNDVAAGQNTELVIDPFEDADVRVRAYSTRAVWLYDRNLFEITGVYVLSPGLINGTSILRPNGKIDDCVLSRGTKLRVVIKNISQESARCTTVLEGNDLLPVERIRRSFADSVLEEMVTEASGPDLPNDDVEEVGLIEGLLRKCRGWFAEGFAAGVAGREDRADMADLASEAPSVRDSLRVLAMQLVSVMEIPLLAARLYWEQVAGLGGEGKKTAVLAFGKCEVKPGEPAKVVVTSPWRYRPTGLVVDGRSAPHFTITEIKVGEDFQPCSTSGDLPCSLFAEHCRPPLVLDMDEAGPGKDVAIRVRNDTSTVRVFSGAILADIIR